MRAHPPRPRGDRPRHPPDVRHQPALDRARGHQHRRAARALSPALAGGRHRPRRLRRASPASPPARRRPIAGGEYVYGIAPFRHMLEARSVDIVMIDLVRVGGITQWMKVAGMAEAFNLPVVSHLIPEVHVHLIAAIPNGHIVEYMPWTRAAVREPAAAGEGRDGRADGSGPRPRLHARHRRGLRAGVVESPRTLGSISTAKPAPADVS